MVNPARDIFYSRCVLTRDMLFSDTCVICFRECWLLERFSYSDEMIYMLFWNEDLERDIRISPEPLL